MLPNNWGWASQRGRGPDHPPGCLFLFWAAVLLGSAALNLGYPSGSFRSWILTLFAGLACAYFLWKHIRTKGTHF